jgi:tRNA1(Val) A37 N6-methylase TrmN6
VTAAVTLDRFLNGRITVAQPISGFRAGHDSVLLAAAVSAQPNSTVLELGSGAGVASLCLAARVPGIRIIGIEIDPDLVRLANENAARNSFANRVSFVLGDAAAAVSILQTTSPNAGRSNCRSASARGSSGGGTSLDERPLVDHVFFNPPFHPDSAHVSPIASRDRATRDSSDAVRAWTGNALSLVYDGGTVTAIVRSDRVDDILNAASGHDAIVFPLPRRAGEPAKRTIVRIIKTGPASDIPESHLPLVGRSIPPKLRSSVGGSGGGRPEVRSRQVTRASGLVLHEADGRPTPAAEAVLRHAQALSLA